MKLLIRQENVPSTTLPTHYYYQKFNFPWSRTHSYDELETNVKNLEQYENVCYEQDLLWYAIDKINPDNNWVWMR